MILDGLPRDFQGAVLPAYAGMILEFCGILGRPQGAPRVCGDDPRAGPAGWSGSIVLPAYAGMIRQEPPGANAWGRAPRVCGDDPL